MQITTGKNKRAQKVVVYGPEGIGKSTFAAQFPGALYADVEGSTDELDVARLPRPSSWEMLLQEAQYVKNNPGICKSLIIDTADWAEKLCANHICAKSKKDGIEDFGYGKGYTYLEEEFGRFLNLLSELLPLGVNVVFTAHAWMRKFEQPDEMGAYDRWELKLQKKTAPLLKEWADMVLFVNYKTYVIKTDEKKAKAQGGARIMYTSHHACWDAKNRHGLSEQLPFSFTEIANCFPVNVVQNSAPASAPKTLAASPLPQIQTPDTVEPEKMNVDLRSEPDQTIEKTVDLQTQEDLSLLPKALAELMKLHGVTIKEIQRAVSSRGYYPIDTPIEKYEQDFITGVLVGAWKQVHKMIQDFRDDDKLKEIVGF